LTARASTPEPHRCVIDYRARESKITKSIGPADLPGLQRFGRRNATRKSSSSNEG
jgi:hypothetical protein